MKIPISVTQIYQSFYDNAHITQIAAGTVIKNWCDTKGWGFSDRIKSEESFALKFETGRYDLASFEDAYACTIIIKHKNEIDECITNLKQNFGFEFIQQRPKDLRTASLRPNVFDFDSVRLYFRPRKEDIPRPHEEQTFEIQIKTFIEHGWSIATHQFHYKANTSSWSRSRISAQIKALLDGAELAIVEAETLSKSTLLDKKDFKLDSINTIISYFKTQWPAGSLPSDGINRLAENVLSVLQMLKKDAVWFIDIMNEETTRGGGSNILSLSPFSASLQSMINVLGISFFDVVQATFNDQNLKHQTHIFLVREIELPTGLELQSYNAFKTL